MSEGKRKSLLLCKQRHPANGVTEAIFPAVIDFNKLDEVDKLADLHACWLKVEGLGLDLYLTGVQYPLVAVLNACHKRGVSVTLYHHSPNDDSWYSQEVL